MLAYQNPTFQTTIEKPIDTIKQAIKTVFAIKKTKYTSPESNELLNTFSCHVMDFLTLVKISIHLEKVDENNTILKVESQSPLGGGLKQTLQRVMDNFLVDITDVISGKLKEQFSSTGVSVPEKATSKDFVRAILIIGIAIAILIYVLK